MNTDRKLMYPAPEPSADTSSIERIESRVRSYCRAFPTTFSTAVNARISDLSGRQYIDFFAGAGALNYGHNNPRANAALIGYLQNNGLMHGLDMATKAKLDFLDAFEAHILKPRSLDYKVQFTGPTGANAVEAALKLARKARKRSHVIGFTNAYHGHSLGALALTGNQRFHHEYAGARQNVSIVPFDGYFGSDADTAAQLRQLLLDGSSGIPVPAAIVLETIQAEGGINEASIDWLRSIRGLCDELDIILIVDDIQTGNGRTGDYFSFENAGIEPDIVCMSKSIGAGLPLSMLLIKPDIDVWEPAEHTGTFRGNQLAFVASSEMLAYWTDSSFAKHLSVVCQQSRYGLNAMLHMLPGATLRGRGMLHGIAIPEAGVAEAIATRCFENGLIIETAGSQNQVLKFLAPLTIETDTLSEGLQILKHSVEQVVAR